jgi:hypothetical protein
MSSITKVNLNSSVVNVGRTTPVSPGPQTASKSIPVVLATDQRPIPVEEQNKVQSEVALSLLGIPRAEVALGIFADVNTYDVNPTEWSNTPEYYVSGHGIKHLPNEAGALVETPRNKNAILTSKRFFRYQPGRVSAATFGIKSSTSIAEYARNQIIRKYGIYDNFDGYYWETRQNGEGDNFSVVRRTQSLLKNPVSPFGNSGTTLAGALDAGARGTIPVTQRDDYRVVGHPPNAEYFKSTGFPKDIKIVKDYKFSLVDYIVQLGANAYNDAWTEATDYDVPGGGVFTTSGNYYKDLKAALNATIGSGDTDGALISDADAAVIEAKCKRDIEYWIDFILLDAEWGGNGHVAVNASSFINAILPRPDLFEHVLYTKAAVEFAAGTSELIESVGNKTLTAEFLDHVQGSFSEIATYFAFDNNGSITNQLPDYATGAGINYGRRNKLDTIYSTKKHYWAYIISEYNPNGTSYQYDIPTKDPLGRPATYTVEEIKYKCQRDSGYLIDAYRDDIIGGGNGSTKFNATMYLRADTTTGLSVYSQKDADGLPLEITRQNFLKNLILHDLIGKDAFTAYRNTVDGTTDYDDTENGENWGIYKNGLQNELGFGYASTSATVSKQETLGNLIVNNIGSEDTSSLSTGLRGYAGNLITLRDGLIMVHAAVNDAAMLKDRVKIPTVADHTTSRFKLTDGVVTFGQHVRYMGPSDGDNATHPAKLVTGGVYQVNKVYGPKGNIFTLKSSSGGTLSFSSDITDSTEVYFETVVPFMMPTAEWFPTFGSEGPQWSYDPESYRAAGKFTSASPDGLGIQNVETRVEFEVNDGNDPFPQGMMFPYMYSSSGNIENWDPNITAVEDMFVGFVNTSNTLETNADINRLKSEIDRVNFIPEYINWIKNNVKPEYWGVYEYRIPRSRYSHDKLNGRSNKIVFSDVATDEGGRVARPGQLYNPGGIQQSYQSVYNFDFTKVTMLKIEFSWYGAVGALFLAYVPVENGEARWVRVHHLRASNQLKISSLGNATLPITYNVYGGGDSISFGDGEEPGGTAPNRKPSQYENYSHNIVKYGASYYIDGGDRGTVRLFSYNNDETVPVYGKLWKCNTVSTGTDSIYGTYVNTDSMSVWDEDTQSVVVNTVNPVFFMGAKVITNNPQDQGLKVVWVDEDQNRAYLNRPFDSAPSEITFIPDRSTSVFGLETKKEILSTVEKNAVRNRVQVYPTKLSTSNLSDTNPIRLRMKKTPLFQNRDVVPQGTLTLSDEYQVTAENLPMPIDPGSASFLENGEQIYGWFRAKIGIDDETVLVRLYKEANEYFADVLESFSGTVVLKQDDFLPEKIFNQRGSQSVVGNIENQISGLSSIVIAKKGQVPIPNTGINITTIYLNKGTEQLELNGYFDYNKEYLSFPLTDLADTLYMTVDSDADQASAADRVSLGITWEEQ